MVLFRWEILVEGTPSVWGDVPDVPAVKVPTLVPFPWTPARYSSLETALLAAEHPKPSFLGAN